MTHSPDTYKIPAVGDTPEVFMWLCSPTRTQANVIHGAKPWGEPPLMLAISCARRFVMLSRRSEKSGGKFRSLARHLLRQSSMQSPAAQFAATDGASPSTPWPSRCFRETIEHKLRVARGRSRLVTF